MNTHHIPPLHDIKRLSFGGTSMRIVARFLVFGIMAAGLVNQPGFAKAQTEHQIQKASFAQEGASQDARDVADWIVDSRDNGKLPFLIVDKKNAKVFVFDPEGKIQGAAPALLGMAHGDDSIPGIGQRELASIRPDERTTPAGRFLGSLGKNLNGVGILWVDYDAAISLHRVVTGNSKQQRAQRLASPTVADNRISFGCINVPPAFYELVEKAFTDAKGIIYVLPETRSLQATFGAYNFGEQVRQSPLSASVQIQDTPLSNDVIKLR